MANFNINKVIIGGRICATPELKKTPTGISTTSFNIAINRKGKSEDADFVTITAWRGNAEFITQYFRKGSSICIVGHLHNENWTDKNGKKRYETKVVCEEAYFVDSKGESSVTSYAAPPQYEEYDDEDTPF